MAQRVQVLLMCDVHEGEAEGTETVLFGLDGSTYEIDLCEQHKSELREDLADYVNAGRKAGKAGRGDTSARRGRAKSSDSAGSASGGHDLAKVREWANANGLQVSARGRVAGTVLAAYDEAH